MLLESNNGFFNPLRKLMLWVSGSIKRKLTFFVVLVCFIMISLVWSLGVMLLEPAYNASIRKDLSQRFETVAKTLDKAYAEGVPIGSFERSVVPTETISEEAIALLQEQLDSGSLSLNNICFDISNANYLSILCIDRLPSNCLLHPHSSAIAPTITLNGNLVRTMRFEVFSYEGDYFVQAFQKQLVLGRTIAGGNYALIASVNIENIDQSVKILQRLMLPLSLSIIAISILAASIFSHWFTRPVSRLSYATKEMAKGNYDVSVRVWGHDEITELANDFNTMAAEVKRSTELQRDLIANVSHDLRTPLTLIKGYAETIRDLSGDDPVKRNEQLTVIMDETDRLNALVGSILEMTRISSGHEKSEPILFNLAQLCDEVGYHYSMVCQKQGFTFDLECDSELTVFGDPDLIERALHNYLGNALAHIGPDGYLGLKAFNTGHGTARVEVIDHGEGIAADDLPHLFDKYYRSRKDSGKTGTGLGLSIAKAIFTANHFEYGVESRLGQGSTFWFEATLY